METGGKGRQLLPRTINCKDQMGPGPDWTLVRYANPHYATKFKPMFILFRQILVTAVAFVFAVTAGRVRAENSFSTVVIDPGHGGSDPGGIPGQIVPEKTVALDTALRLQKLLQRAGLRTVITRSTDIFVPLSVRSAIADAERDAIFVSIHYNASPRRSAHGIETYSENNRGAVLAARIQQEIIDRVSTENRGIRSAEYYVLRKCRFPAVLVECGFLTNPTEAQLALTTAYREQIAERIAAGIIEQRQFAFPPLAPTHRSGRLVNKNKKHRKTVDLERFGKDRRASRTSLMDGSAALLIRSMVIKRQKSRAAATKLLLAAPSMQGAA